jgi:hypothetical protein
MNPTEAELHLSGHVGLLRLIWAVRKGWQRRFNQGHGAGDHVGGAFGECMLAKHKGVFWSGSVGEIYSADVGGCYQVRATNLSEGQLILHKTVYDKDGKIIKEDKDWQPFVLARILLPEIHLVGWSWGWEGKQEKHWRTQGVRYPAYFSMPEHDMATLPSEAEVMAGKPKDAA